MPGVGDPKMREVINDLRKSLPASQRAPSNSQPPSAPVSNPAPVKKSTPQPRTVRQQPKGSSPRTARAATPIPTLAGR